MRKRGELVRVDGLPWFSSKDEQRVFDSKGLACVYALGPTAGRPVKFGWCFRPDDRLTKIQAQHWMQLGVHAISWTAGEALARPLEAEINRILDRAGKRLPSGWFDITPEFAEPTIAVAAKNLGIRTTSHQAMMREITETKDSQVQRAIREARV